MSVKLPRRHSSKVRAAPTIDVIVIGAGIAGLAAAKDIQAAGKRVQVLEARQRVGGRIWSWREWGEPIELGANWIHNTKGNPLVGLAQQAGAETTTDPEEDGDELMIDLTTNKKTTGETLEDMYDRYEAIIDGAVDSADDCAKTCRCARRLPICRPIKNYRLPKNANSKW
jgi:monoamine oxidase